VDAAAAAALLAGLFAFYTSPSVQVRLHAQHAPRAAAIDAHHLLLLYARQPIPHSLTARFRYRREPQRSGGGSWRPLVAPGGRRATFVKPGAREAEIESAVYELRSGTVWVGSGDSATGIISIYTDIDDTVIRRSGEAHRDRIQLIVTGVSCEILRKKSSKSQRPLWSPQSPSEHVLRFRRRSFMPRAMLNACEMITADDSPVCHLQTGTQAEGCTCTV